jgi:hypothetical protein
MITKIAIVAFFAMLTFEACERHAGAEESPYCDALAEARADAELVTLERRYTEATTDQARQQLVTLMQYALSWKTAAHRLCAPSEDGSQPFETENN